MNELEKEILGAAYGEGQYSRISFLCKEDFTLKHNQYFWEIIKDAKGNIPEIMEKSKENKAVLTTVCYMMTMTGYNEIERMAVKLVELTFKRLLTRCLYDTIKKSQNPLERDLLTECANATDSKDIFILADNLLDYIGSQASDYTKERITKYLEYRDKRIKEINEQPR